MTTKAEAIWTLDEFAALVCVGPRPHELYEILREYVAASIDPKEVEQLPYTVREGAPPTTTANNYLMAMRDLGFLLNRADVLALSSATPETTP